MLKSFYRLSYFIRVQPEGITRRTPQVLNHLFYHCYVRMWIGFNWNTIYSSDRFL